MKQPNVVFVFADQWRAQAFGYAGDPNAQTPNIDQLSRESVNFRYAVAGCPVCCPYRATLLTGRYPLSHGVFLNDVQLSHAAVSIADAFKGAGYDTAYIGKWHVDGHGRSSYIPPERRQGFEYWKVLECTHDYNHSAYYANDSDEKRYWQGYDAVAQTEDAQRYIREHDGRKPFLMVLSWGPPHSPYQTAPPEFQARYHSDDLTLRPNVPESEAEWARRALAGYYAHGSALDACVGKLRQTLAEAGLDEDTIFVFASDHGDMLGSHGLKDKQKPWDESIRVPFLLRYPRRFGTGGRVVDALIDAPDIMPTLLGLSGLAIPETVEGLDYSDYLAGGPDPADGAALLACYHPFGQWRAGHDGGSLGLTGREFRGLRTQRYTYVRTLAGPWLLYDNPNDPYQLRNVIEDPEYAPVRSELDFRLERRLAARGDEFLPGLEYVHRWGYPVDQHGTVPYTN